jgi:hypothetical protein
MDSADGVMTHAIWGLTNGLPCKETIEDWQRPNFMSKSGTGKDTKRISVEVSNYTGCPAAQGGTLDLERSVRFYALKRFLLLALIYQSNITVGPLTLPHDYSVLDA